MVGLAALALLGGALIFASRFLPESEPSATQASPTATASPDPKPRPTPTLRPMKAFEVTPAEPELPPEEPPLFIGWVTALVDTPIHAVSSDTGRVVGTLKAGEPAFGNQDSLFDGGQAGWMHVQTGTQEGWIPEELNGAPTIERYQRSGFGEGPSVGSVVAGGDRRFVMTLQGPDGRGNYSSYLMVSDDGARWRIVRDDRWRYSYGLNVAHGPAGWLMVTSGGFRSDKGWLWQSQDAVHWDALGEVGREISPNYELRIAGSDIGYVLYQPYANEPHTAWYSADGQLWSERPLPRGPFLVDTITGTRLGFYAYAYESGPSQLGAFSPDGWTWTEVEHPSGLGSLRGVAAVGLQLLTLAPDGDQITPWVGTIHDGSVTWGRDGTGAGVFAGAMVAGPVVGDGAIASAFGAVPETGEPRWYTNEGTGWRLRALPDNVTDPTYLAAMRDERLVSVTLERTLPNYRPVAWSTTGNQPWRAIEPEVFPRQEVTVELCAELDPSLLTMLNESTYLLAACFDDRAVTVTGYVTPCQGCGGYGEGGSAPAWLSEPPEAGLLHLSAVYSPDGALGWFDTILPPGISKRDRWTNAWVEVVGHFNDPAAERCRFLEEPGMDVWEPYRFDYPAECRARFVADSVRLLPER